MKDLILSKNLPNPSKETHAKNLFVAVTKSFPVVGNAIGEMASQVLKTGEYSEEARLQSLQINWLVDTLPSVLENITNLLEAGIQVEAPDIGSVFEQVLETSRKTTGKKRKYLKNALINSFSVKMYEEGQTLRFLKIISRLEYGDIYLLNYHISRNEDEIFAQQNARAEKQRLKFIEYNESIEDLASCAQPVDLLPDNIWNNMDFHCLNLLDENFLYKHETMNWAWRIRNIAQDFCWFVTDHSENPSC